LGRERKSATIILKNEKSRQKHAGRRKKKPLSPGVNQNTKERRKLRLGGREKEKKSLLTSWGGGGSRFGWGRKGGKFYYAAGSG